MTLIITNGATTKMGGIDCENPSHICDRKFWNQLRNKHQRRPTRKDMVLETQEIQMKKLIVKYLRRLQWGIEDWCDEQAWKDVKPRDDMIRRDPNRLIGTIEFHTSNTSPWADIMK